MAEPRRGLPRVAPAPSTAPVTPAASGAARRGLPRAVAAPPGGTATTAAVGDATAAPRPAPRPAAATRPTVAAPVPRSAARRLADVSGGLTALVVGGFALLVIACAAVLLVRIWLFGSESGAAFLRAYPGEVEPPAWAPEGQPAWAMWQHWLNAFFLVLVIKTGWTVRTQTKPSAMWQPRSGTGKRIAIELWAHLSLDLLWLVNGLVFVVLLFATGQWIRVVPFTWEFLPNALSAALQYVSLSWPTEDGWVNYNALQVLAYFVTIFVAAPLAAVTGFRMSPLWPSRPEGLSRAYPLGLARSIHFPVMLYFVLFVVVHVVLVFATGALRNLNHMFWGTDDSGSWAGFWMFVLGIAAIVGGVVAARPFVMQQLGAVFGKVGR